MKAKKMMLRMNQKLEIQNEVSGSNSNSSSGSNNTSGSNNVSSVNNVKKSATKKEGNVTVVGSIGSVLPQYVVDSINDEKVQMKSSNSSNRDESPDTGDNSIPVNYVLAIGLTAIGLMFILSKKQKA